MRDIISEGRDAPLFHGTITAKAALAIRFDCLIATQSEEDDPMGVSLSRSLSVARHFGRTVFVLDQRRLAQRHRIVPHAGRDDQGREYSRSGQSSEAEEVVIGDINNLDQFLVGIHLTTEIDDLINNTTWLATNAANEILEWLGGRLGVNEVNDDAMRTMLIALRDHPKRIR